MFIVEFNFTGIGEDDSSYAQGAEGGDGAPDFGGGGTGAELRLEVFECHCQSIFISKRGVR